MKEYYTIHEISKLYGVGPDSLRYYEKIGVLTPRRGENGYRYYSLKDIYKLNIIRDLRRLDFSMKQIKEYLDDQSLRNTVELLVEEREMIKKQMEGLRAASSALSARLERLHAASFVREGEVSLITVPERRCLRMGAKITKDEQTDYAIKKLHRKHEDRIRELGNQFIGAMVSMEDYEKGRHNVFSCVFFVLEQKAVQYDFALPAGPYLSLFYRGGYAQSHARIAQLLESAGEQGIRLAGTPFELYHIDNRYTVQPREFLTEVQVLAAPHP